MNVTLRSTTPLENVVDAIRICWDSGDKKDSINLKNEFILGARDKALIERVIEAGHTSTLEHLVFTFHIKNLPRYILQELERHRISSSSVKSSRYTLKELKDEGPFCKSMLQNDYDFERASKYIYLSGIERLDRIAIHELDCVRECIVDGMLNDDVKQILPECYLCDLFFTINARSLFNLLELRSSHRAHKLIQKLANLMYSAVPQQQKFIFTKAIQQGA